MLEPTESDGPGSALLSVDAQNDTLDSQPLEVSEPNCRLVPVTEATLRLDDRGRTEMANIGADLLPVGHIVAEREASVLQDSLGRRLRTSPVRT